MGKLIETGTYLSKLKTRSARRAPTAVIGLPNVDRNVHLHEPKQSGTDSKTTYTNPRDADAAIASFIGAPVTDLADLGKVDYFDGGNVTNVAAGMKKQVGTMRRVWGAVTGRHPVVPYIALGSDAYAQRLGENPAFKTAVVTRYDGDTPFNTVINGGTLKATFALAPVEIPAGFQPDVKKYPKHNIYLTSVKGQDWEQTYRDATQYKRDNPDMVLAVSPGSLQMQKKNRQDPDDAVYGAILACDMLLINRQEALDLIGEPKDSPLSPTQVLNRVSFIGRPFGMVTAMTDGANGAYARDRDGSVYHMPVLSSSEAQKSGVKELQGPIKNPNGGGDAFASAFYQTWLKTSDVQKALRDGALNAEATLREEDANSGQLSRRDTRRAARRLRTYKPVDHSFTDEVQADANLVLKAIMGPQE